MNAFETNLTADWKKKATDEEEEEKGKVESKKDNSEEEWVTGGRVRERDGWGRGVFPLLAMLNHNCGSNARCLSVKESWIGGIRCNIFLYHISKGTYLWQMVGWSAGRQLA